MTPTISRQETSDVKKELIRFAHEEFNNKKPLELRLIQIKPQTIMQKGTVLPNLIIKALKQAAYAIYLDYFDEIRFYFFNLAGHSLGASTLPKSDKILNEMHGKGTNILRLPKPNPLANVDVASMQLRDRFELLARKIEQKINLKITRKLPPVNVIKIQNLAPKIRFGVMLDKQMIGLDSNLLKTPISEIILLRELFPIITGISADTETIQWLGTFWAFGYVEKAVIIEFLQKTASFMVEFPLIMKAIQWWNQVYLLFLNESFENATKLSQSIIEWVLSVWSMPHFRTNEVLLLLILWILKNGKNKIQNYAQITNLPIKLSWINHSLLEFLYQDLELWKKYDIQLSNQFNDENTWWLYFILSVHLGIAFSLSLEQISFLDPPSIFKKIDLGELRNLLYTNHIGQIFTQFPNSLIETYSILIKQMLFAFLLRYSYKIDGPQTIKSVKTEDSRFKIKIRNDSDWILYDVDFKFTWNPENRFIVRKLEDSSSPVFDIERAITAKIMPQNVGSGTIQLRVEFRDPIFPNKRDFMELWQINVEIN